MKITATDYTIQTDSNIISGADNVVGGYGNNVTGTQNIVGGGAGGGLGNTVSGARNLVVGLGHSISGSDNIIGGSYQQGGNNLIVTGSQNNNSGNNIIMAGYLSGFAGGYVLGAGVNIGGAGQYVLAVGNQVGGNGSYNCNIGSVNTHNVDWSFSFGSQNVHIEQWGYCFGDYGKTINKGQLVQSFGKFTNVGDAQTSVMTLRKQTTDDTQTEMALDGGTTYIKTEDNKSYNILVEVVARDTATGDSAVFSSGDGCWFGVKRGTGFATTATIPTAPGTLSPGFADASLSGVALDFDVDTATDGHIKILVTGVAATTINWVARITMTEVGV